VGIMDLGLCQMDQQVALSPGQDVVQGQPDLGHAVYVEPAGNLDLLAHTDLGHPHRRSSPSCQSHAQLPSNQRSGPGTIPVTCGHPDPGT